MKQLFVWALLTWIAFTSLTGCAAYMQGYTTNEARNRYLIVDKESNSLGHRRLKYLQGVCSAMKGFFEAHGFPSFIYEYETQKKRDGIRFYYPEKDTVYIFERQNWEPDSYFLKEQRKLNDYERDADEASKHIELVR